MRPVGVLVVATVVAIGAAILVVTGWSQPRRSLTDSLRRLRRPPVDIVSPAGRRADLGGGWPTRVWVATVDRLGTAGLAVDVVERRLVPSTALRSIARPPEVHLAYLTVAAVVGLLVPSAVLLVLGAVGLVSVPLAVPALVSLVAAVALPAVVHSAAIAEAESVRVDLRHQLSAYLDVVAMLLAGNSGHEGALEQAASAGDGRLFRELRRRMREVSTTGESLVRALSMVADDFALVELEQVAATTSLSAAEGAPVARTLAAKCATLRSTLASESETDARIRNEKLTPPLVGMALLFMALLVYPALNL